MKVLDIILISISFKNSKKLDSKMSHVKVDQAKMELVTLQKNVKTREE